MDRNQDDGIPKASSSKKKRKSDHSTNNPPVISGPSKRCKNTDEREKVTFKKEYFNAGFVLPGLILQLKSILEQYPDDGQILKEIIQNADDAGASKVIFLSDDTNYGEDTSKLHGEGLAQYQGPALFAFNDAVFSRDDWKGIRMIHDSVKADDPMKVGRFGLGFKSVFHMTDLPSMVSGGGIGFFDPHGHFFKMKAEGKKHLKDTSCYPWHLIKDKHDIAQKQYQFDPFKQELFGFTNETLENGYFDGTIFRFPFRNEEMESDLSDTLYDQTKIKSFVNSLEADAQHILLFLKHLESIEFHERKNGETVKLLDIRIEESCRSFVRQQREQFQQKVKDQFENWMKKDSFSAIYPMSVHVTNANGEELISRWLVTQLFAGRDETSHMQVSHDKRQVPEVGIALPIPLNSDRHPICEKPKGHIFCYLPLPLEEESPTGFQFHVHGCFSIDQNRRHLKWPSAEQTQVTDDALVWNEFLVNLVLPKALIHLTKYLITNFSNSSKDTVDDRSNQTNEIRAHIQKNKKYLPQLVYSVLPDKGKVTPQWRNMADSFYKDVWKLPICYTPVLGGKWLNYTECIFDDAENNTHKNVSIVTSVLLAGKQNFSFLPLHAFKCLPVNRNLITIQMIRDCLQEVQNEIDLNDEDRINLLTFFLKSSIDPDHLIGLKLLPLADGSWIEFKPSSCREKVYMESENHPKSLLPGLDHRFLRDTACTPNLASTGGVQLVKLDAEAVAEMMPTIFEKYRREAEVKLQDAGWFTSKWLNEVWKYLCQHFKNDLSKFEDLHLVHLGNSSVVKLSQTLPIISLRYNSREQLELSKELIKLCKAVKILILKSSDDVCNHPAIWDDYVQRPTARGLLAALKRSQDVYGIRSLLQAFTGVSASVKIFFRKFIAEWINSNEVAHADLELLRILPVMSTVKGSGNTKSHFVPVSGVSLAAPRNGIQSVPLPCPQILLDLSDEESSKLALRLGITPLRIEEILTDLYFPAISSNNYTKEEVVKFMQYICANLETFDSTIVPFAAQVQFIANQNEVLLRPYELYDKNDARVAILFEGVDVFPCEEFAKPEYAAALRKLGLKKSNSITADEVLTIVTNLQQHGSVIQSSALLEFLNEHPRLLSSLVHGSDSLRSKLMHLKWVEPTTERPSQYPSSLPFASEFANYTLATSDEVVSSAHAYLIGSVRPTIDTRGISALSREFSWDSKVVIEDVVSHLKNVIEYFCSESYSIYEKLNVLHIISNIYSYFDTHLTEVPKIKAVLKEQQWIWHGEGFARPDEMVLQDLSIILKPYVYSLPTEIRQFRGLWKALEIEEDFRLLDVLGRIKLFHDDSGKTSEEVKRDLDISIRILDKLCDNTDDIDFELVYVPINTKEENKLIMKKISECTSCESEWYKDESNVDDLGDNIHLIHEKIPPNIAIRFQIPSLVSRTLGAEELGPDIAFGQSEPLTRRLHNILRDYSDGLAVLKELIQNADDAGATEIRFIYDERQNSDARTTLINKGMRDFQGPALWCYNNQEFTNEDFTNIVKLSAASKEKATDKIGRFGLGFNAVYNLTDLPMFISGQYIVLLDPHTTNLGNAICDKTKPGIRLDLQKNLNKIKKFADQFKPFNGIFGCDFNTGLPMNSYNGTLFRFALRTYEQAANSEICNIHYDKTKMMELLKLLHDSGHHLMLYTQNIRHISVSHIPKTGNASDIEEWFSFDKELEKVIRNIGLRSNNVSDLQTQTTILKRASCILNDFKLRNIGQIPPKLESSLVLRIKNCCQERFTADNQKSESTTNWLVVSCMGKGESFQLALSDETLIPIGGVAAKLERGDGNVLKLAKLETGLLFCFLPLPISTAFPVNINGYFAVHSSRTEIYKISQLDKEDPRGAWNEALLKDAVAQAYCVLLEDLAKLMPDSDCFQAWPTHSKLDDTDVLHRLTRSVYSSICTNRELKIIKDDAGWGPICSCMVLTSEFKNKNISKTATKVLKKLVPGSIHVVDIPEEIVDTILQTDQENVISERMLNEEDFFKNVFLPGISNVSDSERDSLILHALSCKTLIGHLRDVRCFPVTPDRVISKSASELIHPDSSIAKLFDGEEGKFPMWSSGASGDINFHFINKKLEKLGMRSKEPSLSWTEITDRCFYIQNNPTTAPTRLPIILSVMQSKLQNESTDIGDHIFKKIRKAKILPLLSKPKQLIVKWRGDDFKKNSLISSEESYLEDQKYSACCSFPIIDEHKSFKSSYQAVKLALGLQNKKIPHEALVAQIVEIIRLLDNANEKDSRIYREMYFTTFGLLNTYFVERSITTSISLQLLSTMKCILLDQEHDRYLLMAPDRCVEENKNISERLLPYLAIVPKHMNRSYHEVFRALGVKESFTVENYVSVLRDIEQEFRGQSLDQQHLDIALDLITNFIQPEFKVNKQLAKSIGNFPIPNAVGILCSSESLCYNNCLWKTGMKDRSKFCHARISHPIAETLGLKTVSQDLLEKHQWSFPFGQREKLVNRIRRILDGYPFSEDILKEMLQNADDSGASVIHFIKDPRNLPDERVFDEKWKPLQGPALCIYNNKSFSVQDVIGIQNLGEGSKSEDATKTGQYGVGFNCVYHLTDVPSFLTTVDSSNKNLRVNSDSENYDSIDGTILCIFDPNCKFLPNATRMDPGAMYKIDMLKETFSDVYSGYLQTTENLDISKHGTFFRFPLRNSQTASFSDISKITVDIEKVNEMFQVFKAELSETMLFLNSIEEIHLTEVLEETGEVNELYVVTAHLSDEDRNKKIAFQNYVNEMAGKLKRKEIGIESVKFKDVCYEVVIKDSCGAEMTWQIAQRFGFEDASMIHQTVTEAFANGNLGLLPRGGVAHLKKWKLGNEPNERYRLFCFLPMPVTTNLPVHINGQFALSHESRRGLYTDEHGTFKVHWNKCLMEGVIAPAYCTIIAASRDHLPTRVSQKYREIGMKKYFKLFPEVSGTTESYINDMSKEVYRYIAKKDLKVLPLQSVFSNISTIEWASPCGETNHKIYFDNLADQFHETNSVFSSTQERPTVTPTHPTSKLLGETLVKCGFSLFSCPFLLQSYFKNSGVAVNIVSAEAVMDFFATHGQPMTRCKISNLPRNIKDTQFENIESLVYLLQYCTRSVNFKQRLDGLPFLVTADHMVRTFERKTPKYISDFSDIMPKALDRFILPKISTVLHLGSDNKDSHLCKSFTISGFVEMLPEFLPPKEFFGSESILASKLSLYFPLRNNFDWLKRVWEFIATFCTPSWSSNIAIINPLNNWYLLPVVSDQEQLLYPLCKASSVLLLDNRGFLQQSYVMVMEKIQVVKPNLSCVYSIREQTKNIQLKLFREMFGNAENPKSVLLALKHIMQIHTLENKLNGTECNAILTYFSSCIDQWKSLQGALEILRMLPFFETIYGKFISLKYGNIYVLPSTIPKEGMESWTRTQHLIFLKEQSILTKLFQFLGCKHLSVVDVYCGLVFNQFSLFSAHEKIIHMTFVRSFYQSNMYSSVGRTSTELEVLRNKLKTLPFVPEKYSDAYFTADHFYDPREEVFKAILTDTMFPGEPYCDSAWLDFLHGIGLIVKVTRDKFVEFAKEVEFIAKSDLICAERKSGILLKHLFRRDDLDFVFLSRIQNVAFIPAGKIDEHLCMLHPQYGIRNADNRLNFIAFEGAATESLSELVWTVQNILPPMPLYNNKCSSALKTMNCSTHAEASIVATHANKLCTFLHKDSQILRHKSVLTTHVKAFAEVMNKIYEFFTKLPDIDIKLAEVLSKTSMVIIAELPCLVEPSQVAYDILEDQQIIPYLHKLPSELGPYKNLFVKFGTTKSISLEQYLDVLRRIYSEGPNQELNPDQKSKALSALAGFFRLAENETALSLEGDLFVPCRDGKLYQSSTVVIKDNSWFSRIEKTFNQPIFIDMKKFGYGNEISISIFKKLKPHQQPKLLSSIISEKVDPRCMDGASSLADELRNRLESQSFKDCFKRLLQHSCETGGKKQHKTGASVDEMVNRLERIQFFGKIELKTYLICENEKIAQSERNRKFVIENDGISCKILVNVGYQGETFFDHKLSNAINKIVEERLHGTALMALSIILSCSPALMHATLDEYEISNMNGDTDSFLPPLGSYVPERYHHLLSQDVFVFHAEQIVALEIADPLENGEPGLPVYIFAKVMKKVSGSSDIGAEYRIKVSDTEERTVDSLVLYAFITPNQSEGHEFLSVVLYEGKNEEAAGANQQPQNQNLKDIIAEIKRLLKGAWSLPKEQKNRLIKRLLFRWHPDKNPEQIPLSTKVFQILQNLIAMLEKGQSIDDFDVEKSDTRKYDSGSSGFGFRGFYGFNFSNFKYRTRRQKSSYSHWRQYRRNYRNSSYQDYFRDFNSEPNPQAHEAQRWMRQANHDLESTDSVQTYDWKCMMCYQSAEKALRAAQLAVDSNQPFVPDNLRSLSSRLGDAQLRNLSSELESLLKSSSHLKYPSSHTYPRIPQDVYDVETAEKARELSEKILDLCNNRIQ